MHAACHRALHPGRRLLIPVQTLHAPTVGARALLTVPSAILDGWGIRLRLRGSPAAIILDDAAGLGLYSGRLRARFQALTGGAPGDKRHAFTLVHDDRAAGIHGAA